jgi:O-antigen/teichoic acid export membrane protein
LSVAALGVALWLTRSLPAAVCAQAAGRLLVLLAYDRPKGQAGESLAASEIRNQTAILRIALPLGVVLMLISLAASLPRYAIEHNLGMAELGLFTAPASFITVGATLVNAFGQAATPRLARAFSERDVRGFRRLAAQLTAVSGVLGVAGIGAALVAGRFALRLVYGPAYSASSGLLIWLMCAGLVSYLAGALGYIITSARAFAAQAPLFAAVAVASGLSSWLLVPRFGLQGAALALGMSSLVQFLGAFVILRRSLRVSREGAS